MVDGTIRTHIREAIRQFYRRVGLRRAPRRPKLPNAVTRRALDDVEARRGLTRYEDFDDFARAMTGR